MSSTPVRFCREQTTLSRTIGSEVICAVVDREGFECLSETATAAWRLLEIPLTGPDLMRLLADLYGVAAEAIASDVAALLDELCRRGLIRQIEGQG